MPEQLPIEDDVVLKIDGQQWRGWQDISLERSLERCSGAFSLTLADEAPSLPLDGAIAAGKYCEITFGSDLVLAGWIDTVEPSYNATSHTIRITGRDKVGDLMDCAATVSGPFEYRNVKLETVVAAILAPYKIKLTVAADTGAPFKRFSIQPGETAFEVIERACRHRALLPVSDGIGGLAIVKPGTENDSGETLEFGVNILRASSSDDWRDRHSVYISLGHTEADGDEDQETLSKPRGLAKDPEVTRYRPGVAVSEAEGDTLSLDKRAEWQAKVNRARSSTATYTLRGWRGAAGVLWAVNCLVSLKDKPGRRNGKALISALRFTRDNSGTRTELTVVPPDAFVLPAEADKPQEDGE